MGVARVSRLVFFGVLVFLFFLSFSGVLCCVSVGVVVLLCVLQVLQSFCSSERKREITYGNYISVT